jgi:dihydrofolate reductase
MPQIVSELIVSLDGYSHGTQSPGYFGYFGPEFEKAIADNQSVPHQSILGRKSYEALNGLPAEVRDEGWKTMAETQGWLFSRTLDQVEWPNLKLVKQDAVEFVREIKASDGPEIRTLGSMSIVKQLLAAGLLDRLRLWVCPLILGKTGDEPAFAGLPDIGLKLVGQKVLDGRVLELDYQPDGLPPKA